MDWQSMFYFVGTIFMIFMMAVLICAAVFLYKIRQKLMLLTKLVDRPAQTASEIGVGIAEGVAVKIKEWTNKKASV